VSDRPWFAGEAQRFDGDAAKRHAPATLRNRDVIADVLARELPTSGLVLEVASGSCEHIIHFAKRFPAHEWQPSDPDPVARASIAAWAEEAALANIHPPIEIDASAADWPINASDAILCINMAHIAPWAATAGVIAGGARLLKHGSPLIFYGPFLKADIETAPSNLAFDAQLRTRDPSYGIRSVEDVDREAIVHGLVRTACHYMPANNLMLVYRIN
jgi:hypothetical protein